MNPAATILLDHAPPEFKALWRTRVAWRKTMHQGQVSPAGDWLGWVVQAGRGFGKTLVGSFDVIEHSLDYDHYRYGVIAPTLGDVRATCYEGETGILTLMTIGNEQIPGMGLQEDRDFTYNRSRLEIEFPNGSHIKGFGAEKPDRLRGPQHHRVWFEEAASYKDAWKGDSLNTAFNNALLGLRLKGKGPTQYIVTTTPRPLRLMTELVEKEGVEITRGSTHDNLANLSTQFAQALLVYEGTHLGRQELSGEIITEDPRALWRWDWIEPHRLDEAPDMVQIAVGVDPSGGADEVGIVTAGRIASPCPCGLEDNTGAHYAVLDDVSGRYSPEGWAAATGRTYRDHEADIIAAEQNYGGQMVEATIRNHDISLPVKMVVASRGKQVRAEPIALLYEKGRVHHVGAFPALESQYTTWVPGETPWSPNRLDAAVWALTYVSTGPIGARTIRMPSGKVFSPR
jgi:phage terminase large subunit-like protein